MTFVRLFNASLHPPMHARALEEVVEAEPEEWRTMLPEGVIPIVDLLGEAVVKTKGYRGRIEWEDERGTSTTDDDGVVVCVGAKDNLHETIRQIRTFSTQSQNHLTYEGERTRQDQ